MTEILPRLSFLFLSIILIFNPLRLLPYSCNIFRSSVCCGRIKLEHPNGPSDGRTAHASSSNLFELAVDVKSLLAFIREKVGHDIFARIVKLKAGISRVVVQFEAKKKLTGMDRIDRMKKKQ